MKKKILITGGTGLVGSYLTEAMLLDGTFEIYILGRNKNEAWAGKNIHYIEVDLATDWMKVFCRMIFIRSYTCHRQKISGSFQRKQKKYFISIR